jgi:CheY-like chemotaxis protein/HPt (histidine-containing phosphotransfer) domain-containing protein
MGLQVDIAKNGSEAVEKAVEGSYDLILMDLQMPVMDGFTAAKNIRTINTSIPIIALSAAVMEKDKQLTQEAGMNGHLAKPIDLQELQKILANYLKIAGSTVKEDSTDTIVIDGVDIAHLQKQFKPKRIASFLKTFAKTQRDTCYKLQKIQLFSDEFKSTIHTLKGVSGNLFISKIYELTISIEKATDPDATQKIVSKLCQEMRLIIDSIDHTFPPENEIESIPTSREETIELINTVLAILKSNSLVDESMLTIFITTIKPFASHDMSQKIINAIEAFDFKTAITLIETVKEAYNE